ncbi:MAG: extracellular solute-binding protein [Butyrivibrio sp.]|nr:extracellular solute-binding protein [Butyrivibrio sp.]
MGISKGEGFMKKKLVLFLTMTMVTASLSACGGKAEQTNADAPAAEKTEVKADETASEDKGADTTAEVTAEPITVDFWNSWTGSDGDVLVEKVNEFNSTNPWGITINMDITPEFSERLATTLPTGDCAPLILSGTGDRFRYGDYLLPIDDIWENTSLAEADFNENAMDCCKMDGSLYAVPFQNSLYYMYWNKDLFEKAGLDPEAPPKNFDEWAEYASKITDPDANVYGSGMFMSYGCHQFCLMGVEGGWAITKADGGKWNVNFKDNENYKKYLEWMKEVYTKGDNPMENEIDSMFKAGQIGIMVNGPWLAAGADEAGINYGMCKVFGTEPRGDVAGFFITNSATDEEKLACERFIQWWYTGNEGTAIEDTGVGVWSLKIGFPTAYNPLAESDAYKSNERLSALALDSTSKDSIWIITDPDFKGWAEMIGTIGTLAESVIYDTPIDEALEAAQAEAEELVKTYEGEDALAQ